VEHGVEHGVEHTNEKSALRAYPFLAIFQIPVNSQY
jgi:hypothetical protein